MEIWKEVKGYEGLYQVSNLGNVKALAKEWICGNYNSLRRKEEILLIPAPNDRGYLAVKLSKNGISKMIRVNRLVAQHFINNPLGLKEVNHIDCDKNNNSVSNLEWCTRKQNMLHASINGLLNPQRGEKQGTSKLTEREVFEIRAKYIPKIYTQEMLAKEYGVNRTGIQKIIKRKTWKHV